MFYIFIIFSVEFTFNVFLLLYFKAWYESTFLWHYIFWLLLYFCLLTFNFYYYLLFRLSLFFYFRPLFNLCVLRWWRDYFWWDFLGTFLLIVHYWSWRYLRFLFWLILIDLRWIFIKRWSFYLISRRNFTFFHINLLPLL